MTESGAKPGMQFMHSVPESPAPVDELVDLDRLVPADGLGGVGIDELRSDVDAIRSLEPGIEGLAADAFRLAVTDVFSVAAWVGVASVFVALTIPQLHLRETLGDAAEAT